MISVIKPEKLPGGYIAFTTTNKNGADFNKFNVRSIAYYSELKEQFNLPKLITVHQQHKGNVLRVHAQNYLSADGASADGLFTTSSGISLGVVTADCYPVVLIGNKSISVLHCGWKSIADNIIDNCMRMYVSVGDHPIYAYVGAGISASNFEVKDDFINKISAVGEPTPFLEQKDNKFYFDLQRFIVHNLERAGVSNIEIAGLCTYDDPELYSYRRDGVKSGRMLTVVYKCQ